MYLYIDERSSLLRSCYRRIFPRSIIFRSSTFNNVTEILPFQYWPVSVRRKGGRKINSILPTTIASNYSDIVKFRSSILNVKLRELWIDVQSTAMGQLKRGESNKRERLDYPFTIRTIHFHNISENRWLLYSEALCRKNCQRSRVESYVIRPC